MHTFFLFQDTISGSSITITNPEQVHHLRDVLRIKPKESLVIVDRQGNEYFCLAEALYPEVRLKIEKACSAKKKKSKISLTIACALPKNSNIDDIIDKLTQLGVDKIIPFESKRVIVKLDESKKRLKVGRWQKIAVSASQQCQRNRLPQVDCVRKLTEIIRNETSYDLKLIPTLPGERLSLRGALQKRPKTVLMLIGPEGDFTDEEIDMAKDAGFVPVSLGDLVLRVETAAVACASFIMLYENG